MALILLVWPPYSSWCWSVSYRSSVAFFTVYSLCHVVDAYAPFCQFCLWMLHYPLSLSFIDVISCSLMFFFPVDVCPQQLLSLRLVNGCDDFRLFLRIIRRMARQSGQKTVMPQSGVYLLVINNTCSSKLLWIMASQKILYFGFTCRCISSKESMRYSCTQYRN